MSSTGLWIFVAALVAVYLLPGPDMAMVISTSAIGGSRNGLFVALGLALSRTTHVTLSAIGFAAAFRTHPILFDIVRWFGAAYFVWIGLKILESGKDKSPEAKIEAHAGVQAVRRGFLTNMLNPKALMFCALLLPQFISTQESLFAQYLLLGSILVGIGFFFDVTYALVACRFAQWSAKSSTIQKLAKLLFSGIFIISAVRLAIAGL